MRKMPGCCGVTWSKKPPGCGCRSHEIDLVPVGSRQVAAGLECCWPMGAPNQALQRTACRGWW
jgi:hypothetical protein